MKVVKVNKSKFYSDLPDVDCDFPTWARDKVKEYIRQTYGDVYSCSVCTFARMKLKTCLKDFAKVKGLPFDLMNKLTKDIDDQIDYSWSDLIAYASKSKLLFKFVQENPDLIHLTKYALQQCKAASIHPSAFIIVPKQTKDGKDINIFKWMPVKKIDGLLVSEWEGKYTESALFLKEDILGLSQLDKFQIILDLIKKNQCKEINLNSITFDDSEVYRYFQKGWCEDVFQFGTSSLMNYCKQLKPTHLSDLIAATALFRPGPISSGSHLDFVEIKHGKKKPKYDYGVQNITEETYSLLVYQEQMMNYIRQLGGMSFVDAENVRGYIKKKKHKELAAMSERFISGAIKNGCPEDEAKRIWDKMNAFSSYAFNKSHAAAYTVMSYWSMWLKVNYPLEFWTASLQEAKESEIPYRLAEMKKTGVDIEIRPPDINLSTDKFTCDPENDRIFFNLNKIKGVGDVAVQAILDTREKGGQFFSLEEFLSRVPSKVNKSVVKWLIIAGAFDLIEDIKQPLERKKLLEKYLLEMKRDKELPEEYRTIDARLTNSFWIFEQKRLTGYGDVDYEAMIKDKVDNRSVVKNFLTPLEFNNAANDTKATLAGKMIFYVERNTKNGKMCQLQLDCNNDILQVTLWADTYEKLGGEEEIARLKNKVIAINGTVKKDKFKNMKVLYSDKMTRIYEIG